MRKYWDSNGKTFNWTGLSTELKEHVIQFCICDFKTFQPDYFHGVFAFRLRKRQTYPSEVTQRLGSWKALLYVSTQVHALTLRLCFSGSESFPHGFCITSYSYPEFQRRIYRLGMYYHTVEPGAMVSEDLRSQTLASRYKTFPKIFPELKRYATYVHGIRKICLQFDFFSFFRLFKVTAGGFARMRQPHYMTCNVFDRMPHLDALIIILPTGTAQSLQDQPRQYPKLFHRHSPCPRILLRFIYERIAVELTSYEDLTVKNFLDADEEEHFENRRDKARLALKSKPGERNELYADIEGGIELEDHSNLIAEKKDITKTNSPSNSSVCGDLAPPVDFFPPRCDCNYPCERIFKGLD